MKDIKISEWNASYNRGENYVWYPENEMVRFISKYFVKRTGIQELAYNNSYVASEKLTGLDFGCGIGRGVFLMDDFDIEAYGVDISENALACAKEIALSKGRESLVERFILSDGVSELPFLSDYFDMVVSHGVLDSMPFEIARKNIYMISKIVKKGGLFYLDLISDDSSHSEGFEGEETVKTLHEENTIQSFFTISKLEKMLVDTDFEIVEATKKKTSNLMSDQYHSRIYIVLKKAKA